MNCKGFTLVLNNYQRKMDMTPIRTNIKDGALDSLINTQGWVIINIKE